VLDNLKRELDAFMASNERETGHPPRRGRETQADFGIAERGGKRIYADARA